MTISHAERRQIENEMIYRRRNEKVGDDLGALDAQHIEEGNISLISDADQILRFKCECSDENCEERIPMRLSEYQEIHTDRDTFVVMTNHQVDPIEKIVRTTDEYTVVKKNNSTPEPGDTLNETTINNTSI